MSNHIENKLENIEKQVEKLATITAQGFERVDEKFEKLEKKMNQQFDGVNNRIDDLAHTRAKVDVVTNLEHRVTTLEKTIT